MNEWNVRRVMMIGALAGLAVTALQMTGAAPQGAEGTANLIGQFLGAAIGGALMFGLVAWIRNAAGRRRQ